jgi:hypothetical protein
VALQLSQDTEQKAIIKSHPAMPRGTHSKEASCWSRRAATSGIDMNRGDG